jgi:hypothetical protein
LQGYLLWFGGAFRHCEERSDEAIQSFRVRGSGLLRGACHRAALRADPLARNDERPAASKEAAADFTRSLYT